jgi:predicted nucleotidyltransferase
MGTKVDDASSLGGALFTKTQRQVLGLLFGNPERSFYAKEVVRLADVGSGTVLRELEKLFRAGLLTVEKIGNQKHYRPNRKSPVFEELHGIVIKTFGLADVLRKALGKFEEKITVAFIYGSIAKGTDQAGSDIDLMIIADALTYPDIMGEMAKAEARLGRTVSPTLYRSAEFRNKFSADSGFLKRVLEQPKIFLIGSNDDLPT